MVSDVWPTTFTRRYFARINRKGFGGPANPDHPILTLRGELNELDCDCVAEMTFPSEKAFRVFYKRIYEKETAAILAEDENKFLEKGKVRVIVVGETWSTGPDGVTTSQISEITRNEALASVSMPPLVRRGVPFLLNCTAPVNAPNNAMISFNSKP